jgi:hypothetical protein
MARRNKPYVVPLLERLPLLTADGPAPAVRPDLGPCLLWQAHIRPDGYARVSVNGRQIPAHRAVYLELVGPIPADRPHLDHLCRVPSCVRPAHLEPVTQAENNRRQALYRVLATHCKNGHPLDGDNLRIVGRERRCVTCVRANGLAYYYRTRGERVAPSGQRTHCPAGHPYDEANTYLARRRGGGVNRMCRECGNARRRKVVAA